jgi:hypothetical protein
LNCNRRVVVDGQLLNHAVHEVRLSVLCVGQKANERVFTRGKVGRERLTHSGIDACNAANWLTWRRSIHFLHPLHEI